MTKTELKKISNDIPFRKKEVIAKKTGYSTGYLSRFFAGEYPITSENVCIIVEAKRIIQKETETIKFALLGRKKTIK